MNALIFKPIPGFLLVEQILVKPKSTVGKSNIIIPEQSRGKANDFETMTETFDEWPFQAKVVAIGDPTPTIPMPEQLKVGSIVYLKRDLTPSDGVIINHKGYGNIRLSDIQVFSI